MFLENGDEKFQLDSESDWTNDELHFTGEPIRIFPEQSISANTTGRIQSPHIVPRLNTHQDLSYYRAISGGSSS